MRSHSSSLPSCLVTAIKVSPAARAGRWLVLLTALLVPFAARGQATVRAITSVSAGGSDNARGLGDRQRRTTSLFGRTSGALQLGYRTANTSHLLHGAVGATGTASEEGLRNFSQELSAASVLSWSRGMLELGATGARSQLDDLTPLIDPGLAGLDAPDPVMPPFTDQIRTDEEITPTGTMGYIGGSASESLALELSPVWNLYQSTGADAFSTVRAGDPDPFIWSVTTDAGLERAFVRDALRLEATAGRQVVPTMLTEDGLLPAQTGDFGRLALGWSHQLSEKWRTDVAGGAYAGRASQLHDWAFGPAWRGGLHWRGQQFRVSGLYDRSVQPSVTLGGIFLTDRASIRAVGRFGSEERFRVRGILRYQRMSALGPVIPLPAPPPPVDPSLMNPPGPPPEDPGVPSEEVSNTVAHRWQAQLTLSWVPWHNRLVELAATYRLTSQLGATLGRRRLRTFERNLVLLTLTVGFPLARDEE
jgi:hypothetical protein